MKYTRALIQSILEVLSKYGEILYREGMENFLTGATAYGTPNRLEWGITGGWAYNCKLILTPQGAMVSSSPLNPKRDLEDKINEELRVVLSGA